MGGPSPLPRAGNPPERPFEHIRHEVKNAEDKSGAGHQSHQEQRPAGRESAAGAVQEINCRHPEHNEEQPRIKMPPSLGFFFWACHVMSKASPGVPVNIFFQNPANSDIFLLDKALATGLKYRL